jgi:transcriptional regulator with XRE-family HTH domain
VVLVPSLRRIRENQGLTQRALAARAGIAKSTISRGETGGEIRISSVRKLAAALEVRIVALTRS